MKNATAHGKKLVALLKKLKKSYKIEVPTDVPDPVTTLVRGFFLWEVDAPMADEAYFRIMAGMIDINELRATHPHQVAELLGPAYPLGIDRCARMRDSLNAIFAREHELSMSTVASKAKKDIKTYLDTLPGMTPYVSALVQLLCFAGHAFPVDERLSRLLKEADAVDPEASVAEIEGYLERQLKADETLEAHLVLRAWSDAEGFTPAPLPVEPLKKPRKIPEPEPEPEPVAPPAKKKAAAPAQTTAKKRKK